jgi:Kef-type K+ transport system membrane component KefB
MITGYLYDIIVIFAFAVIIIAIGNKVRIPGIVGFIITGILIRPYVKTRRESGSRSSSRINRQNSV